MIIYAIEKVKFAREHTLNSSRALYHSIQNFFPIIFSIHRRAQKFYQSLEKTIIVRQIHCKFIVTSDDETRVKC